MKTRFLALLLVAFASASAAAQKTPAEVTDADITKYKSMAETSCRDAGAKQGDPKEKIDAFCGCLMSTLNKSMARAEWQQAYLHSTKGETKEEMQVLNPHLKNVAACQPKAAEPPKEAPQSQNSLGLKPPSK